MSDDKELVLHQAVDYFNAGDFDQARQYYEQARDHYGAHLFKRSIELCDWMSRKAWANYISTTMTSSRVQAEGVFVDDIIAIPSKKYLLEEGSFFDFVEIEVSQKSANLVLTASVNYQLLNDRKKNKAVLLFEFFDKDGNKIDKISGLSVSAAFKKNFLYLNVDSENLNDYPKEIINLRLDEKIARVKIQVSSFGLKKTEQVALKIQGCIFSKSINKILIEKDLTDSELVLEVTANLTRAKTDHLVSTLPIIASKKKQMHWVTSNKENDAFLFQKDLVEVSNDALTEGFLTKKGVSYLLEVDDVDSIIIRFALTAEEPNHEAKQAILTIDYLDKDGKSLKASVEQDYSSSLNSYYSYLSVEPNQLNNVLLCPPPNTESIRINIRLWKNNTNILFDGIIKSIIQERGVSVVIPSYKGEKTIIKCLQSLFKQTLNKEKFEVIVALNGERDSTRHQLEKFLENKSQFNVRILELNIASAGNARNEAIKSSQFGYITFVDDDDYVDENYLKSLLLKASPETIILSGMNEEIEGSGEINDSSMTKRLIWAKTKEHITYQDITSVLTMNACKLAPSHMVKSVLYNPKLKSGEDVVYWCKLISLFSPSIDIAEDFDSSVYYRVITDNSVSRQSESYDFNVSQRLDVIKDLIALFNIHKCDASFIQLLISLQANFIKKYLSKNPSDYYKFRDDIVLLDINNSFVGSINELFSERLVVSYCFAPYADTSAVVMSKRINQMDDPVDVISNSMSKVRSKDLSLSKIYSFNVGRHIELSAPQAFSNWKAIDKFSELTLREFNKIISQREMYKEIYSRSMWLASHFAAALIKIKYPQLKWIAEFSDPILMDVTGKERHVSLSLDWLENNGFISDKTQELNDNLFYWCEKLVYDFADEIIFTNENQKNYMISYSNGSESVINDKAKVIPQPTLPKKYYQLSSLLFEKEKDIVYLGYFGSFYVNRGFDTLIDGWVSLPKQYKEKLRFYIYTQQEREQVLEKIPDEIREFIHIDKYVEYFDFLSLSNQFDWLLVADAQTEGSKINNPYLPSKISDYLGGEAKVLALVEKNSPMDCLTNTKLEKVLLKDVNRMKSVLLEILSEQ